MLSLLAIYLFRPEDVFMKFALLLLILSVPAFSQTIQKRVERLNGSYEVKYDKFTRITAVTTKDDAYVYSTNGAPTELVTVSIDVRRNPPLSRLILIFEPSLIHGSTLRLLADKHLIAVRAWKVSTGTYASLNAQHLRRLARAKTVEVQLGSFEGEFTSDTLRTFKELYSLTL